MNLPDEKTPREIEIKFFIRDMPALKNKLVVLNAVLVTERTHELNYRFDTPDQKYGRS